MLPNRLSLEKKFARDLDALTAAVSRALYPRGVTGREHVSCIVAKLETLNPGLAARISELLSRGDLEGVEQTTHDGLNALSAFDADLFAPSAITRDEVFALVLKANNELTPEAGSDRYGYLWGHVDRANAWALWQMAYEARLKLKDALKQKPTLHPRGVACDNSGGRIRGVV